MAHNSKKTTTSAITVAVQNDGMRYGRCHNPEANPRFHGEPRPDSLPSSCAASVKPIEIPAPTEARGRLERCPGILCRKGGGEDRRKGGD